MSVRQAACVLGASLALVHSASAQGYRLRVDTRVQGVSFRGVTFDSVAVTDTVSGPGGGPGTSDGYAVNCLPGGAYCHYFRPGPILHSAPIVTSADLVLWGFGVPGLSARVSARASGDLSDARLWPGSTPRFQLLEGYLEYAEARLTARIGRHVATSRLGYAGFDGGRVLVRDTRRGLEFDGYLGWGLTNGVALPVTSPALNPLDDFQPRRRQLVAGAGAGWTTGFADVRADYRREVDPGSDYFVSERVAVEAALRPLSGVQLAGGADYDLAAGWWGSGEASLGYSTRKVRAVVGVRRYRPHFDLWTIWGAFSPVPYRTVQASLSVVATSRLELRGRWERYKFDPAEASTPLFNAKRDGWRWEVGGTITPLPNWMVDGGYRLEFGPGAGAAAVAGSVTYGPSRRLAVTLFGSTATRPLEFRFNEAEVRSYGVDAQLEPTSRVRLGLSVNRYEELHRRPDAAAFDWDQLRASARVAVLFGSHADLRGLPPAIRLLPGGRAAR